MSGPQAKHSPNETQEVAAVESQKSGINPLASHLETVKEELARCWENQRLQMAPLASSDSPSIVGNPDMPVVEDGK